MEERKLFELDYYYDQIKDYTPKTIFFEVTKEEAVVWKFHNMGKKLDENGAKTLEGLKQKMEKSVKEFEKTGAFVRLSTRSPKDAVDKIPNKIIPFIIQNLKEMKIKKKDQDFSSQLLALRKSFFSAMKVTNSDEAFDLIMYSSRTVSDIVRALNYSHLCDWHMKVIVREFVELNLEGEMRGFVYKNKLTALSQYYCDLYIPFLSKNKKVISEKIQSFFVDKIKEIVKEDNYVVDFVINKEKDNWDIKIVELNPFSQSTGACLFDWKKDKELIYSETPESAFEFRVCDKEVSKKAKNLIVPWYHLVESAFEQMNKKK
eukprot:TRINITY_DN6999_c0_g1_i2.p1 TRINITY_DN6999_c0_g1~~TRINITY_DN6999_c0_g1_i2.p1  ORF type:complete len:341 (-),score=95.99 TRINITY_DN6999_c0_g1_i2:22-972(-)